MKPIYINSEKTLYNIDTDGTIYSNYTNKGKVINHKLKPHITESGYAVVCLYHNNTKYWRYVHRLVAIAYIPIPEELSGYTLNDLEVNHKDGSFKGKSNNSVSNLEWVTSSGNKIHAYSTNLKRRGEDSTISIYTNDQIRNVCKLLEENELGNRDIWKKTGVSVNTIQAILSGIQWKQISKDYNFRYHKKRHILYSSKEKEDALNMLKTSDLSFKDIGDCIGMTRNAVWFLNKKYSIRKENRTHRLSKGKTE